MYAMVMVTMQEIYSTICHVQNDIIKLTKPGSVFSDPLILSLNAQPLSA